MILVSAHNFDIDV